MHRKMKNRKGKDLFMKKKIRLITGFGRHMSKSNVNAFASSSAYFMFLSIIPIIILLCSLLPLTTLQKSDLLKAVSEVMPSPIVPMMSSLIESLYNSTVGVTSVAAIVTVWSASKGMLSIPHWIYIDVIHIPILSEIYINIHNLLLAKVLVILLLNYL